MPNVNQVVAPRQDLPRLWAECLQANPLLARIVGECRTCGWSEGEILIVQLLAAVQSNASLQARLAELETTLALRNQ